MGGGNGPTLYELRGSVRADGVGVGCGMRAREEKRGREER